jgi:hypothetical protein
MKKAIVILLAVMVVAGLAYAAAAQSEGKSYAEGGAAVRAARPAA